MGGDKDILPSAKSKGVPLRRWNGLRKVSLAMCSTHPLTQTTGDGHSSSSSSREGCTIHTLPLRPEKEYEVGSCSADARQLLRKMKEGSRYFQGSRLVSISKGTVIMKILRTTPLMKSWLMPCIKIQRRCGSRNLISAQSSSYSYFVLL